MILDLKHCEQVYFIPIYPWRFLFILAGPKEVCNLPLGERFGLLCFKQILNLYAISCVYTKSYNPVLNSHSKVIHTFII